MAGLASRLADRHQVTLITLDVVSADRYPVDPRVRRVGLGLMSSSPHLGRALGANIRRIRCLRQAIGESTPDVILSFCDKTNLTVLAAVGRKSPIPVVISEHSDPREQRLGLSWALLRKLLYRRAASAIVLSEGVAEYLRRWISRPIAVIAPAVDPPQSSLLVRPADPSIPAKEAESFVWIAVGRLSEEKGFHHAIAAIDRLRSLPTPDSARHEIMVPNVQLWIAGEGPSRQSLEAQIDRLGLRSNVRLLGWVKNIPQLLERGDGYVLTSRYEGFPVGLLEALAQGLPCVAFDCPSGPREILQSGTNGWLVPNQALDPLVETMALVMQQPDAAASCGEAGREVLRRYSWDALVTAHEAVLARAVSGRCGGRSGGIDD